MNQLSIPVAAKAYVALLGSVATALLGVYAADTPVGKVLTIIVVVATAIGTWAVPNQKASPAPEFAEGGARMRSKNEFGYVTSPYGGWILVIIAVMVFLILLMVAGVIKVG